MATLDQSQVAGSTLGYAQITSNLTTTSTSMVQATGLSVTVTIPSGGRRIKITGYCPQAALSTGGFLTLSVWDGVVGSGTQLNYALVQMVSGLGNNVAQIVATATPSAGSKTYNIGWDVSTGTGTLNAAATSPAYILVELI